MSAQDLPELGQGDSYADSLTIPCPRCGREDETAEVCCSSHGLTMCASCYCSTHFVEGKTRDVLVKTAQARARHFREAQA